MEVNHIAIVVKDIEESIEYYRTYFGFEPVSTIYDDPTQKTRIAFVKPPDQNLKFELLEPTAEDSPVMNALKKGGGLNHICYEVQDIKHTLQTLLDKGSRLISGPTPAVAFGNKNIAFLYTKQREIIELLET